MCSCPTYKVLTQCAPGLCNGCTGRLYSGKTRSSFFLVTRVFHHKTHRKTVPARSNGLRPY